MTQSCHVVIRYESSCQLYRFRSQLLAVYRWIGDFGVKVEINKKSGNQQEIYLYLKINLRTVADKQEAVNCGAMVRDKSKFIQ